MSVFNFRERNPSKEDEGILYELSATTDINISSIGVVTSSPVEDGSSIADNAYLDNRTVDFQGVITSVRVAGSVEDLNVKAWIDKIQSLRKAKKLFIVTADTEVIPNAFITRFDISKTKVEGLSGWKCSLSFKELDISERARLVEVKVPKTEVKDVVTPPTNTSGSSTSQVVTSSAGLDVFLLGQTFAKGVTNANTNIGQ